MAGLLGGWVRRGMTPVDVCAEDTTAETGVTQRSSTREASYGTSAHSPLLAPFEVRYGEDREEVGRRARTMGGSVPASRLAAAAAVSLGLVAVAAVVAGSRTRHEMALAARTSSRAAVATTHPRRTQMAAGAGAAPELVAVAADEAPALSGVDVVAFRFLSEGADPVYGSAEFAHTVSTPDIGGAHSFETTFWFSSSRNRDLFASNPAKYAPRFGGFCSYGITSEFAEGWDSSMDDADATEGWPWDRDHLGPPTDLRVWTILDDKLYFAFLPAVMDVFRDDYAALAATGEQRWREWFGDDDLAGPFNVQCMAKSYGPPTTRTCTYRAQDYYEALAPRRLALDDACLTDLNGACGDQQGNDPVRDNACSTCLDDHYDALELACPTTDGALQAHVDKVFCW